MSKKNLSGAAAPDSKEYSINPIELKLVESVQQSYFQALSNVLSFIALERLAYPVTENTRFRIEGDKIFIHEEAPEEQVSTVATKES